MSDASRFVDVFRSAALQAGAVARRFRGEVRWRSKRGGTPESEALSTADLATQDVLLLRLAEAFPEVAVDAEEDTETTRLFPAGDDRPVVVVDPIDGSLNYLRGSDDYAVMAAWIEDGRYRAAVMYFPEWRTTFWAEHRRGCFRQVDGQAPAPVRLGELRLPHRILVPPRTPGGARRRVEELGYEVVQSRCSAVDAAAPAVARGLGSLNVHEPDRRRAIGFLLAVEAGGVVLFDDGPWDDVDPERVERPLHAHAVAVTEELARALLAGERPGRGAPPAEPPRPA